MNTVSDGVSDGDMNVTISVAADGYRSANAGLTVTDAVTLPNVRFTTEVIPTPSDASWFIINGLTNSQMAYGRYDYNAWVYDQLTGTTPFDKSRLSGASVEEIRRII